MILNPDFVKQQTKFPYGSIFKCPICKIESNWLVGKEELDTWKKEHICRKQTLNLRRIK